MFCITRIWRSRGYGIQSPRDYSFLREVLQGDCGNLFRQKMDKERRYRRVCESIRKYKNEKKIDMIVINCLYEVATDKVVATNKFDWCSRNNACVGVFLWINENKKTKELWKQIVSECKKGTMWDGKDIGVIVMDERENKKYYKVNF